MVTNEAFSIKSLLDFIDIATDVGRAAKEYKKELSSKASGNYGGRYSYSSIMKAASDLVAVFPVLCSSNVSRDTASLISKVIEQQGCIGLQLVLSAVNLNSAADGFEYLKKFHQNLKTGNATLDDLGVAIGRIATSGKGYQESVDFRLDIQQTNRLVQVMKESFNQYYEDNYNHMSLNDFRINESANGYHVSISQLPKDRVAKIREDGKMYLGSELQGSGKTQQRKTSADDKRLVQLRDSDTRKANESVPSLLIVRFTTNGAATGGEPVTTEFIIGVKAKLIATDYMEILNKIYTNNRDGQGLANLIRFTSGEIRFVKDILLGVDKARDEILSIKRGSKEQIWKTLQYRAQKSKYMISRGLNNDASAITTVVLTAEDADYLFKEENVNIKDPKVARRFMESYNLFGLVVVNDAEEVAWFMYDNGEQYFEKVAYDMLERDTGDGQFKKIVNLMSTMR